MSEHEDKRPWCEWAQLHQDECEVAVFRTTDADQIWDNESGPEGATNTVRGLIHSLDLTKEGLGMKPTRICSIENCERPLDRSSARGMCSLHYPKWLAKNKPKQCAVEGCTTKSGVKSSMCPKHQSRVYIHGTTDSPVRQSICSIDGCTEKFLANGLCRLHYGRQRRTGTTDAPQRLTNAERIKRRVDIVDLGHDTHCWIYTGRLQVNGYASMRIGHGATRAKAMVHRVSYESFVGPIPDGLVIDHLCCHPACCNPDHLEPVTQKENMRRSSRWTKQDGAA